MKCYIVRDLLPRYLDELTGEEASGEIKTHLDTCESCRTIYMQMRADIPQELSLEERKIDFFKKLKKRLRRQEAVIALSAVLVLLALMVLMKYLNIPVPYNQEHIAVGVEHTIAISEPPYQTMWRDLDLLDFEATKAFLAGEYEDCERRDFVKLQYSGFDNTNIQKYGRTLNRNGEMVDVVYFCATRELWDMLFSGDHVQEERRGGWTIIGNLDDNTVYHAYTPRMTEIYYLPMRSISRLAGLSDDAFDAERRKGVLVWSGVI